ncbi:hypothetical protein LSAT2_014892 [Lamellibrachia satsuma]|nr:hypothetical protein LSAT2_014892 [Lamellibrachia satsuma]
MGRICSRHWDVIDESRARPIGSALMQPRAASSETTGPGDGSSIKYVTLRQWMGWGGSMGYFVTLHAGACYFVTLHAGACYFVTLHAGACYFVTLHAGAGYLVTLHAGACYFVTLHAGACYFVTLHAGACYFVTLHAGACYFVTLHAGACYFVTLHAGACYFVTLHAGACYFVTLHAGACYFVTLHAGACYFVTLHAGACYFVTLHAGAGYLVTPHTLFSCDAESRDCSYHMVDLHHPVPVARTCQISSRKVASNQGVPGGVHDIAFARHAWSGSHKKGNFCVRAVVAEKTVILVSTGMPRSSSRKTRRMTYTRFRCHNGLRTFIARKYEGNVSVEVKASYIQRLSLVRKRVHSLAYPTLARLREFAEKRVESLESRFLQLLQLLQLHFINISTGVVTALNVSCDETFEVGRAAEAKLVEVPSQTSR